MRANIREKIVLILSFVLIFLQFYVVIVRPLLPVLMRSFHLSISLMLVFIYFKSSKRLIVDWILFILTVFCAFYALFNAERFSVRIPFVDDVLWSDIFITLVYIVLLLEAVRRMTGNSLFLIVFSFLIYALLGKYFPSWLWFRGFTFKRLTDVMFLTDLGTFGLPLGVAVSEIFYFLLFGVLFSASGGGELFIDIALKISGKTVGGPAKTSVIGSSLFGMLSGSAVANVMTTGIFTIPLMKRSGYSPEEAAAVEAAASTGGQIAPPVMGAAAFIMAEIIGMKYIEIARSAILPAVFYYVAIFLVVDLLARKRKLRGIEVKVEPILPRIYLLAPAVVLVYFLVVGRSLGYSAVRATLTCILVGFINKRNRWTLRSIYKVLLETAKEVSSVAIPVAASGIIIGVATQSGLALKASAQIISLAHGSLWLSLLLGLGICIILGMGVPTVAAYSIGAVLIAPTLVSLGIKPLVAHFFVFFFAVLAMITPPVCVATFAAAGLAQSDMWKTGLKAFIFTLPAFFVPFICVSYPEILLSGSLLRVLTISIATIIGIWSIAIGVTGYMFKEVSIILRLAHIAAGIAVLIPERASSLIGVGLFFALLFFEFLTRKTK